MRGPTHIALGLCSGMLLASALKLEPREVNWFMLLLGSLAPDIDEDESSIAKGGNLFGVALPRVVSGLLNVLTQSISKILKLLVGHRGLTHWPIIPALAICFSLYYQIPWLFWFSLGYLVHLLADACTVSGIPFFAPLSFEPWRWSRFRTGSKGEKLIALLCAAYMAYWGWAFAVPEEMKALITKRINS